MAPQQATPETSRFASVLQAASTKIQQRVGRGLRGPLRRIGRCRGAHCSAKAHGVSGRPETPPSYEQRPLTAAARRHNSSQERHIQEKKWTQRRSSRRIQVHRRRRRRPKKSSHPSLSDLASSIASKLSLSSSKPPPPPPPRLLRSPPMKRPQNRPSRVYSRSRTSSTTHCSGSIKQAPGHAEGLQPQTTVQSPAARRGPRDLLRRCQFDHRTLIAVQTTRGGVEAGAT